MIDALHELHTSERERLLAAVTAYLLPQYDEETELTETGESVLQEIRHRLELEPSDNSPAARASMFTMLSEEMSAPLKSNDERREMARIRVSQRLGSWPPPVGTWANSIGMEFIIIPAGEFLMGSPDSNPNALSDEKPAHQVTISQPFYLGKYPVTQRQWQAVMGTNPSYFKGEERPVENVSWEDVQVFLQALADRERVNHYRLPTEAEWEYACRAGTSTVYHFGDNEVRLGDYAWYNRNLDGQTHPVGQKKPNDWGLYDMHGNVWEWVQDWYGPYTAESVTDPVGPEAGAGRVIRGGSWYIPAQDARSAFRSGVGPGSRYGDLGFRCLSSVVSQ